MLFDFAVPPAPMQIEEPAESYQELLGILDEVGLHIQSASSAQVGQMSRTAQMVNATILERAGQGFSRIFELAPRSDTRPGVIDFNLIPGESFEVYFPSSSSAYRNEPALCETVIQLASMATWYRIAESEIHSGSRPHNAQATYNLRQIEWNGTQRERKALKDKAEEAAVNFMGYAALYPLHYEQAASESENESTFEWVPLFTEATINWGRGIEECLREWR